MFRTHSTDRCFKWSNFEIGSLNWLRSQQYLDFFNFLDKEGGFFYERWGDAPVHSIAAGLMLKKEEIHFFNEIAYYHPPFLHCPTGEPLKRELKCHCSQRQNFDWMEWSCEYPQPEMGTQFSNVNPKRLTQILPTTSTPKTERVRRGTAADCGGGGQNSRG